MSHAREEPPERSGDGGETRLSELEIKLAFMERELETWKEAVNALHERLERSEAELQDALRQLQGADALDQPFVGGGGREDEGGGDAGEAS